MFRLDNQNALITGAGSGIGRAIANLFAQQGATVWVVDQNAGAGQEAAAEIRGAGGQAFFESLDVRDTLAAQALAARLPSLDVLVNNAGIGHVGTLLETNASDMDVLYEVNVRGSFNLCKAFVPAMIERHSGSVIMLGSIGGVVGIRDRLAYTMSKHAVVGMTRAMALDHSSSGVRFNAICPGRVETPFVKARLAEYTDPLAAYQQMSSTQLNGRMVRSEEVAAAALYLAAKVSEMVTGSCHMIDGGWNAGK